LQERRGLSLSLAAFAEGNAHLQKGALDLAAEAFARSEGALGC